MTDSVKEKLEDLLGSCAIEESITIEPVAGSRLVDFLVNHGVTVQEWVSVKDRLPEKDEVVIIYTDRNFIYAGELIGETWFLDHDSWTETVTHWMPLPEPPKAEEG